MFSVRGLLFCRCLEKRGLAERNVSVTNVRQKSQDTSKNKKDTNIPKSTLKVIDKKAPNQADAKSAEHTVKMQNEPPKKMLSNTKTEFGPLKDCDRIFQNLYGRHDWRLKGVCKFGDWYRTADLLEMGPDWIVDEIMKSGLRGRAGNGFYSGNKMNYLKQVKAKGKVMVLNCAEGEPGTCKDRDILRHEPHKIIEGCLLTGFAMGCEKCIVYCSNKFYREACNLQFALAEAYRYGLLGCNACDLGIKFDMYVQWGSGYLTGEETALINCLMGKIGIPRKSPPYMQDYFNHPSLVFNAESIAVVPTILRRGAKWWTGLGRNKNFGTKLFNISGHVNNPCTVEEEMSMPLKDIIEKHAGGVCGGWKNLQAVFPGGLSTPLLSKVTADLALMDFDSLESMGSQMGTGGIIVICQDSDPLLIMQRSIEFFTQHSCKQCTGCRDAANWFPQIFKSFARGETHPQMIDFVDFIQKRMRGKSMCSLSDSLSNVAHSLVQQFGPLIEQRIVKCGKDC